MLISFLHIEPQLEPQLEQLDLFTSSPLHLVKHSPPPEISRDLQRPRSAVQFPGAFRSTSAWPVPFCWPPWTRKASCSSRWTPGRWGRWGERTLKNSTNEKLSKLKNCTVKIVKIARHSCCVSVGFCRHAEVC
jgi:hypothetical protein